MSDTTQAIEKLIADLDKGRAEGGIYTYGQVQERLREILAAQVVPQPNREALARLLHTTHCGCKDFGDESEDSSYWRMADAVISHLSAQTVGGEVEALRAENRRLNSLLSESTAEIQALRAELDDDVPTAAQWDAEAHS